MSLIAGYVPGYDANPMNDERVRVEGGVTHLKCYHPSMVITYLCLKPFWGDLLSFAFSFMGTMSCLCLHSRHKCVAYACGKTNLSSPLFYLEINIPPVH